MTGNPHILVVDDDREIRTLLAEHLEQAGFNTETAADGAQMRARLALRTPDLILLDLNLPGQDGLELCRDLRAGSAVPVIMLTARNEPLDRILGLEMGAVVAPQVIVGQRAQVPVDHHDA